MIPPIDWLIPPAVQPSITYFHQLMTPAQYGAFLPDQDSVQAVRAALVQSSATLERVADDGRPTDASGDAATIERAFGSPIHMFTSGGKTFARTRARQVLAGARRGPVGSERPTTFRGNRTGVRF